MPSKSQLSGAWTQPTLPASLSLMFSNH